MYKKTCRIYALLFALTFCQVTGNSFVHANTYEDSQLEESYQKIMGYSDSKRISLEMEWSDFRNEYYQLKCDSVEEYENLYYNLLESDEDRILNKRNIRKGSSSGSSPYYYCTGTSCPKEATYKKYKLTKTLQQGDIIYEAEGGRGITGHIAIVEGIYKDNGKEYVRIIEAIDKGVKRGILDDKRYDEKKVSVYRVNTSNANKIAAVAFCKSQLGKKYKLDLRKDTSKNEPDWYCSELVWAAYKSVGIDLETNGLYNEPGVTPRDISVFGRQSSYVYVYK